MDEQVLEGDRAQVEAGVAGLAAVRLVEPAVDMADLVRPSWRSRSTVWPATNRSTASAGPVTSAPRARSTSVSSWSTSRPLSMITTSSNSGLSSSIRWVETTIVRGWAMKSDSTSSWKAAREGASMPRWDSSNKVTGALEASPKVIPRADRWPRESSPSFLRRGTWKRSTSESA